MQIRKDIPSKMYHYTSLESLCSIVENQEFWLGDTRQMNDYNEALELLNILNSLLNEDSDLRDDPQCRDVILSINRNTLLKTPIYVDEAMDLAVKAQTYRGRVEKVDQKVDYIWDRIKERDNQFVYRINRNSRIFDLLKEKVDDETWNRLDMVLDEIENSVPYQQIYIDKSQNRVDDTVNDERIAEIESKARILIKMSMAMGAADRNAVIERLFQSEPFCKYPDLEEKLREA